MSYNELNELLNGRKILYGVNQDGEKVIVQKQRTCIATTTSQDNNWLRINYYYPDGSTEETYRR